ncbi:MAG: VOC family protein [Parvularculaceae bacterium]
MAEATSALPIGAYTYLSVVGGTKAVEFYKNAFGAVQEFCNMAEDGKRIMHARLRINGAAILLSDDFPEFCGGGELPKPAGVMIHLEVDDADKWFKRASDAGATVIMPLADMFWGDRYGQVLDPFGHKWSIGAPIKK